MSDVQTLDLFRIHEDRHALDTLHSLQHERLAERSVTGNDRPAGMRLSIADPVRRVKAAFDPWWGLNLDDGIGMRGHLLEDYLQVALFDDDCLGGRYYAHPFEAQVPIQWHEHGRSAFDWVVTANAADRVVSCKSSIKGGKPSASNIAQERRMMALSGYPAGSVFEVWVIDPSTFRATGPYEYTLDADHITDARRELESVSAAYAHFASVDDPTTDPVWDDPDAWKRAFGLETTSGAFRYPSLDANAAIEARNRAFLRAREAAALAKANLDAATAAIRPHVEEQVELARRTDPKAKSVTAYGGNTIATYTLTSNGQMRVTEREDVDAAAA